MTQRTGLDERKLQELEEKFDPEMRFRPTVPPAPDRQGLLIPLSCFHYYTAGFGLLRETTHRGVHLAFVLGLIFLVFAARKALLRRAREHRLAVHPAACRWPTGCSRSRSRRCSTSPTSSTTSRSASATRDLLDVVMGTILVVRCSRPRGAAWAGRCR